MSSSPTPNRQIGTASRSRVYVKGSYPIQINHVGGGTTVTVFTPRPTTKFVVYMLALQRQLRPASFGGYSGPTREIQIKSDDAVIDAFIFNRYGGLTGGVAVMNRCIHGPVPMYIGNGEGEPLKITSTGSLFYGHATCGEIDA